MTRCRPSSGQRPWQLAAIITHLELGGAQLATLAQLRGSRFIEGPRTLLARAQGRLVNRVKALPNIEFRSIPSLRREIAPHADIYAIWALASELRRLRLRSSSSLLVHTHSPKAGIVGRLAARLAGAEAVIHSVHGFGHGHGAGGGLARLAERAASVLADGYTTDSASNRDQGLRERLFAGRPVEVIHCGFDEHRFQPDPRARDELRRNWDLTPSSTLVVSLANMKTQKDPMTFLDVAERVLGVEPHCVFYYAGDGPLRGRMEAAIARSPFSHRIRLLGWRDDAESVLNAADIFLLTSRWEGLPQSFGQAMAVGLPIVATRVDGAQEAVIDGKTGFLRPAGDAPALADAVLTLLRDASLRRAFGKAGCEHAARFGERAMIAKLDRFYAEITASGACRVSSFGAGNRK